MFRSILRVARAPTARIPLQRAAPAFSALQKPLFVQNVLPSVRYYGHAPELTREIVTERVLELLEGFDKILPAWLVDQSKLSLEANFSNDLGLDSLDIVEVVMALEEEFSINVGDEEADNIKSVKQAIDFICAQPDAL